MALRARKVSGAFEKRAPGNRVKGVENFLSDGSPFQFSDY